MPKNNWLDSIASVLSQIDAASSLGNVQRKLDEYKFSEDPLIYSYAKPASLGIEALSQLGRPIAAVGGMIGANESEAAQEARARLESSAPIALEGAKQGFGEGAETFKDTVSALDLASIAAGGAGGVLGKSAKTLKLANLANKADLGLSAADAALGGGNVYEGVRDEDLAKTAMGVARIAGNAYGGHKALKDINTTSALDEILNPVEARHLRSHKGPIEGYKGRVGDEDTLSVLERTPDRDTIAPYLNRYQDEFDSTESLSEGVRYTPDMRGKAYEDADGFQYQDVDGEKFPMKTRHKGVDRNGEGYTIESLDDYFEARDEDLGVKDAPSKSYVENNLSKNPAVDDFVTWVRGLDAEGQNELIGNLSRALDPVTTGTPQPGISDFPGTNNPLAILANSGKFRGLFVGGRAEGFTWADKLGTRLVKNEAGEMVEVNAPRKPGKSKPYADKAYFLDPTKVAKDTVNEWEALLRDPRNSNNLAVSTWLDELNPDVKTYVDGVLAGEARIPELESKYQAQIFMRTMMYNALHESFGHARPDTAHVKYSPAYRTKVSDTTGKEVGTKFMPVNVRGKDPAAYSAFEPLHNAVVNALNDPNLLRVSKSLSDDQQIKMFNAFLGDNTEVAMGVKKATDRVRGRAESKAAMRESRAGEPLETGTPSNRTTDDVITDLMEVRSELKAIEARYERVGRLKDSLKDTGLLEAKARAATLQREYEQLVAGGQKPPTPPDSVPPSSSGGEPFGPQLEPLSVRLKKALTEHQKAVNENQIRREQINTLRADKLRENEEKLFGQLISPEDFGIERKKIMSGSYDLIGQVNPMVLQGGDEMAMMQKIAQQSNDDAFLRNRAQIAFDKMTNGERLEDNEIGLMRKLLTQQGEDVKADPLYQRLGSFFANTTGSARALLTSFDLSAAGRQALFASVMNPTATKEAFKAQLKALAMSHSEFNTFMGRLQDPQFNPYAQVAKAAGLHFSETAGQATGKTAEEAFMHGKWAEKIPGVRRTEQAYIAYLNKMRVELFNKHLRVMEQSGEPLFDATMGVSQRVQDLAYMVNTLTGRGEMSLFHMSPNSPLGKKLGLEKAWAPGKEMMDKSHEALTSVFFAPRFAASRAALMRDTIQAMVGGGLDPEVSKIYMKNVIGTLGAMTAVAGGLASMGVGTFQTDPRKKDFGVLKVGNTRYDFYGGLKPWAKIVSVLYNDEYYSGRSRIPKKYGDGPMSKTKTEELFKFGKSKLSPMAGFIVEAMTGEDFMGRKAKLWESAYGHTVPMIAQTIIDLHREDELDQLAYAVPASVVGFGVNTYSDRRFNRRDR